MSSAALTPSTAMRDRSRMRQIIAASIIAVTASAALAGEPTWTFETHGGVVYGHVTDGKSHTEERHAT
jgi:hypothetical protein